MKHLASVLVKLSGVMYTTWQNNDAALEAFARLCR